MTALQIVAMLLGLHYPIGLSKFAPMIFYSK